MPITTKLIDTSTGEWARWGYSTWALHEAPVIAGKEKATPFSGYVSDYWTVVGQPTWNGNTPQAWSAAFISFCFKNAGAGKKFPYASGHAGYCAAILKSPSKYPLTIEDPASAVLAVGDVIWAARAGDGCVQPPKTYAKAIAALKNGAWFCSHCDIVVGLRTGEADVIGGNVSNSVTKVTYVTADGHIRDTRRDWIGVIKSAI